MIIKIIHWVARIWGSVVVLFLLFMVGAHIIGSLTGNGETNNGGLDSAREILSFLYFPFIIVGLTLALKWEGVGGLITVIGMIGLYILRPDLILDPMMTALAFPGILYLLSWYLKRDK